MIYLKQLATPPIDAGTFDKSEMWINLGLHGFEIADVADRSPAQEAGLAVGDVIVAIDAEPAASLTLARARELFRMRPDGTVMRLQVLRSGTPRATSIALRSPL